MYLIIVLPMFTMRSSKGYYLLSTYSKLLGERSKHDIAIVMHALAAYENSLFPIPIL